MNQLTHPASSACSLGSKDHSAHSTIAAFPVSIRFDGATHGPKQSPISSLTCRANILQEGPTQFQSSVLNFIESIYSQTKFKRVKDQDKYDGVESLVLTVSVSSAVKLGENQIELIEKKMKLITGFPKLRLESTVDPSLIAGFVIRYGMDESSVIDMSVKGQLAMLANQAEASDKRLHGLP